MSALTHGYQHWTGTSTSIWQRRAAITRYGLRLCWRSKILKFIFAVAWAVALALIAFHFLIGQLLSPESALLGYITENFGKKAKAMIDGLAAWVLLYPDVSVDGIYRTTFFYASQLYAILCFYAVALFVPKLISHDLSSRAILVYNSKALTRFDYLIGKFGIVFSLLFTLALAPLLVTWLVSNLLSPGWSFFWYGFPSLVSAIVAGLVTVGSISLFALAVSSLAKKTSSATAFWILAWIVSGSVAGAAERVFSWGRYLSPSNCLRAISSHLFDLTQVVEHAKDVLPFFRSMVESMPRKTPVLMSTPTDTIWVPILFLSAFCALAILAISKRVQPE